MPNIGYVNGRFLPLEEACVSVEDRGFQFGDGVYEVIRVYGGKPFRLKEHLSRLERSAQAIAISVPLSPGEWEAKVNEGIRLSGFPDGKVYIQLTRGVAPRDHQFPASPDPTLVMTVREMPPVDSRMMAEGVTAMTLPDLRWGRCDIKSLNLLPNVLAKQQAKESGAFEAIFVRDGLVTEGTSSNVMLGCEGVLLTPALGDNLLAGVTRQEVLDLAREEGIPMEERSVTLGELKAADELFLVGTTIEILPVTQLDGKPVADGKPGPMAIGLASRFKALVG